MKDVDLSAARIEQTDAPLIDGRPTEEAWGKAAIMPFEKTGEARFVWSQKKLYGFISKYEHQKFGFDFDEQICVAVGVGNRVAKLYFEEKRRADGAPSGLALREAWVDDWPLETANRELIKGELVEVASLSGMHQQGWGWSVEFSLDWNSFAASPPRDEQTTIRVYRLTPSAPITHVPRMGMVGKKTGGQQAAGADLASPGSAQP